MMNILVVYSVFSMVAFTEAAPLQEHILSRAPRAVFDLIPNTRVQHREDKRVQGKVFISGSPCPCPEGECVVDHDLECRRILNILHSKETLFSTQRQRHRRHRIKKLFRTFIRQGGDNIKIQKHNHNNNNKNNNRQKNGAHS